jgi:diguanylate cyclase (GGDEF)-like protein
MNIRILVVDDEETIRGLLTQVLTEEGHEVTGVASGEQALEAFHKHHYPVVISDIRMEGMSGIELLHEIKRLKQNTQVLMITSHSSIESAISALRAGAYDYVIKPFEDLDVITAAVNRAIEKICYINENQNLVENLKKNKKELERLNEVFWDMAVRDGLTGLHNHRYFNEFLSAELSRSIRHKRNFSLLFIDVDFFKAYNDTHGHLEGDIVLCELAQIFQKRLRKIDMIARYGGEEFVILLPEVKKDGAYIVAENIRKLVEEHPFRGRETQPQGRVTVSIGVATFPGDGENRAFLIKSADEALYRAKNNGRNAVK